MFNCVFGKVTFAVISPRTASNTLDVAFWPAVVVTFVMVPTVLASTTVRLFPDESVQVVVVVLKSLAVNRMYGVGSPVKFPPEAYAVPVPSAAVFQPLNV